MPAKWTIASVLPRLKFKLKPQSVHMSSKKDMALVLGMRGAANPMKKEMSSTKETSEIFEIWSAGAEDIWEVSVRDGERDANTLQGGVDGVEQSCGRQQENDIGKKGRRSGWRCAKQP